MYKINLIKTHQYFSNKKNYKTVWDLNLAELLVLEQLANGHKWMSEIRNNCGMQDYTISKAVSRLSEGYYTENNGKSYKIEGLDLLTKHRDGKYKFMSFTSKGLQVRDAIMDYLAKKTEQGNDVIFKKHIDNQVEKIESLMNKLKQDLIKA